MSHAFEYCREIIFHSFLKMAAGGHFGCLKFFVVCISHHFRSKHNFYFFAQNGRRQPCWMSEINFCLHFWPFQIKTQLSFYFKRCPKLNFVCISRLFSPFLFAFHYLRCIMNLPMRNGEHAQLHQSS